MRLDLVDVFANGPQSGNPLAVVRGEVALSDAQMATLARWLGYSETTFLLPPTDPAADYRVRIFGPAGELPFAGHPTLGSAFSWLAAGGEPRHPGMVMQECGIGLVEVRRDVGQLAFRAPPLTRSGPLSPADRAEAIRVAGVREAAVSDAVHAANGPDWQLLRIASLDVLLAAEPVSRARPGTMLGLVAPHPAGSRTAFELRAFAADAAGRVIEDPVTGSLNAAAAQYLLASGQVRGSYLAAQGQKVGADGRVQVHVDAGGAVWIGGVVRAVAMGARLTPLA
ncbi:PhzF family phenazine biosynthesis protein [Novosphingobium bradum]|uniref:PhzF family phenazine biosynthesis protein n=1 Tax=Novosphingobium bradum TaxID=1737444 RepID=A0ABV7IK99_9SPHN